MASQCKPLFLTILNTLKGLEIQAAEAMTPIRLCSVSGHEGRINDVLFHPPAARSDLSATVVFFPGDLQDFPEVMESHRDNRNYLKWNLENMATLLSHNFPKSNILVVRPSRIEFKSFSCYDNFVPSNNAGVPDHTPTHYALHHLERLLQGVTHRLKAMPTSELTDALSFLANQEDIDIDVLQDSEVGPLSTETTSTPCEMSDTSATHYANSTGVIQTPHAQPGSIVHGEDNHRHRQSQEHENPLWWREGLALDKSALTLIGFSKGCVVLNQLIYEFHYVKTLTPDDAVMMRFMQRIVNMYWLDGGHAGGKNTWITSRSLLETLTRLDVNIYVHVSPYQIQDERRPWIGREERAFMKLLRDLGAKVCRYLHRQRTGGTQTLLTHLEVLTSFKQLQDTTPPCVPSDTDES